MNRTVNSALKNILAIVFGLIISMILLLAIDFIVGLYNVGPNTVSDVNLITTPPAESLKENSNPSMPTDFINHYPGVFSRMHDLDVEERSDFQIWNNFDDKLGSVNGRNVVVRHQLRKGNSYIFNVKYVTDQYGRRVTPSATPQKGNKFIAYFGCSFTWGSCLADNQTLPYLVSKLAPKFVPYNYARGASGSNYLLALLENRKLSEEIPEREGVGIYVFINDHVERTMGDVFNTASMYFMPFYEYVNGVPTRNGNFLTGRPVTTLFFRALYKTQIFRALRITYPKPAEKDFNLVCDLIEKSKEQFLNTFPSSKFHVLFHPSYSSYATDIIPCLKSKGISYLNYQGIYGSRNWDELKIPYDGHPNFLANQIIAERLTKDLKLDE